VKDDCHAFGLKIRGEKGSARRSVVVMQQPVLLSPKFAANASQVTVVCGIDCLAYQDKFFVNNPLDVKENYEHGLDFALYLSRLFRSP
jgi:hypothetical protein